jgi:hypothetical protein
LIAKRLLAATAYYAASFSGSFFNAFRSDRMFRLYIPKMPNIPLFNSIE